MTDDGPLTVAFTPMPDDIMKALGITAAAVWGRMWRYAQMRDGLCRASLKTLADDLGLSRVTIVKHIADLEAAGFLLDTTPSAVKTIHLYRVIAPSSSIESELDEKGKLVQFLSQTSSVSCKSSSETEHKESTKKQKKVLPNGIEPKSKKPKADKPPKPEPDGRVKAVVVGFQDLVGYRLANWPAESKAAAGMLKDGYEAADMFGCWRYMTSDDFWNGKHCGLQSVAKQIGAWVKAGRPASRQCGGSNGINRGGSARPSWADPAAYTGPSWDEELKRRTAESGGVSDL